MDMLLDSEMILRRATKADPTSLPTAAPQQKTTSTPGSIAGAVLGGLAFLIVVILAFILLRRRKQALPIPETSSRSSDIEKGISLDSTSTKSILVASSTTTKDESFKVSSPGEIEPAQIIDPKASSPGTHRESLSASLYSRASFLATSHYIQSEDVPPMPELHSESKPRDLTNMIELPGGPLGRPPRTPMIEVEADVPLRAEARTGAGYAQSSGAAAAAAGGTAPGRGGPETRRNPPGETT